jgi:hypothetical protein
VGDIGLALIIAVLFSLVLCSIEVRRSSKNASLANCATPSLLLYILVVVIGNTSTTLLVAASVPDEISAPAVGQASSPTPPLRDSTLISRVLRKAPWFWYAFLGVFGFEVLLRNINVSFLNKGLLSISDWIAKARDGAVEAAVKAEADSITRNTQALVAEKLCGLEAGKLDAQVVTLLGAARVSELTAVSKKTGADLKLLKALALASEKYDLASAIKV